MPIYFYGISDMSINIVNEDYLDELDLFSQQILERCGDNIYIPSNFPYKNLFKIYFPESVSKLLFAFKSPTTLSHFEIYRTHFLEDEFYIISFPKHYDFRITGINGTSTNTHIIKVNKNNRRVYFIDYSNYLEREILVRHFDDFKNIFLSFSNFHLATGLPHISGCVNHINFNIRKLVMINPLVSFLNTQKSLINNLFLINREDNNILDYVNCNFGNIPLYYPKFLFYRKQNNKVYKYNFTNNTMDEVSGIPLTLLQLNSTGHDIEEIYNMDFNVITNFFNSNNIDILLNGWIPTFLPTFTYNNKTYIYAKVSNSGIIENLVLGEVI